MEVRGCFHFCRALHVDSACQFELEQPKYWSNAFCEGQMLELISTCSARQKWKQPRMVSAAAEELNLDFASRITSVARNQ